MSSNLLNVTPYEQKSKGYCGPACLKMVLEYYGIVKDEEELAELAECTPQYGVSGEAITFLGYQDHDAFRQILGRYHLTVHELPRENFPVLPFVTRFEDHPRRNGHYGDGNGGRYQGDRDERRPFPPRRREVSRSLTRE